MADWKGILGQIAPTISKVVGTVNPLAGMGLAFLSNKLLGHPNGTQDDIAAAMATATPEQLLALKQAENEFKAKMTELGVKVDELDAADRGSARNAFGAIKFIPQMVLTGITMLSLCAIAVAYIANMTTLNPSNQVMVSMLVTAFIAWSAQQMNFWFGSSHSSQRKDEALANAALS